MKLNILIVEDEDTNAKILNFYFTEYCKVNNIENFNIDIASNGWEALGMYSYKQYDIVFLDVMMPKCDGFKVLNTIRVIKKNDYQPYICMVTSLGEDKHRLLFKLKGANSYAIKPFKKEIILNILDKFVKNKTKKDKQNEIDDIVNSFNINFDDFYKEESLKDDIAKEHIVPISAVEFLAEYDDIEYILSDIDDISYILENLILDLDIASYSMHQKDIELAFNKYIIFLNSFLSFERIVSPIYNINNKLSNLEIENYNEEDSIFIVEFLRGILIDLRDWKNKVFIEQTTDNIFYIDDSIISSCTELEKIIDNG